MTSSMSKPFHCSDCGKEFSKEKKLLSHFKVHSTGKTYKCEVCELTFSQKPLYKKHIKTHFENGSCNCPKCGKEFVRSSWLKKHMSAPCDEPTINVNKFVCKDCGKMYDSLAGIRSHIRKGKHSLPDFLCHVCKWSCSTSKGLFIHILQHSDADLIVVGVDKEQRLEYFSTSKLRANIDLTSLWSTNGKQSNITVKEDLPLLIDIDAYENSVEFEDSVNEQAESSESQNTMQSTEILPSKEFTSEETTNSPTPAALEEEYTGGLSNNISLQGSEIQMSAMSPSESLKGITVDDKETHDENMSQNQQELQINNTACTIQPDNISQQQNIDLIPKKMPKLVSLYPEEEQSQDNNSSALVNSNVVLQNDLQMQNGIICNGMAPDPATMAYTASPIVNTMFLPPLFLVQNSLPANPNLRTQNTYLMGDTLIDNLPMVEKTSGVTIMDELKSMTNDITLPKKKKKCQGRNGKKYVGVFKKLEKKDSPSNDATANGSVQHYHEISEIAPNTSIPLLSSQNLDSKQSHDDGSMQETPLQGQDNSLTLQEQNAGCDTNSFTTGQKDHYSGSNIWETLMGIDESDGTITSTASTFNNKTQTSRKIQKRPKLSGKHNTTLVRGEKQTLQKKARDNTNGKCQQQHPKDGIDVEDYIKKFMWL